MDNKKTSLLSLLNDMINLSPKELNLAFYLNLDEHT